MATRKKRLGPDAFGVHPVWVDAAEAIHRVSESSVERLHAVIGEPPIDLDAQAPIVTRPGRDLGMGPVQITLESGETVDSDGLLSSDFPTGYHWAVAPSGLRRRLIVSPGRCWLPPGRQGWGWAVQLYGVRSGDSWGMGDLSDLRMIREWAQRAGAEFLMVNPLHAVAPTLPQEPSPYLPATRRFRSPLYLCVEEVPGVIVTDADRSHARQLNASDLVDRDEVWRLKDSVLRSGFRSGVGQDEFVQWRAGQGQELEQYAVWCALTLGHGYSWRTWPESLQDPASSAVSNYATDHVDEVDYHAWLQWHLDRQFAAASGGLMVIQDLPIGVSGDGFDAWTWQHLLAEGMTVGAPPDLFNTAGQDWGSPPFVPWRLREDNYEAFAQTIRASMAAQGGLRIDHVMGLFRLWWVPDGSSSKDGGYVRYPAEDLLDIVALESRRARAVVVGEDLGTVEEGVREALADRAVLSYRLVWFEDDEPSEWAALSMSAVTTHDLPTVVGLWSGDDVVEQHRYTRISRENARAGQAELRARLAKGARRIATAEDAVLAAHRRLAEAPSRLLCATLEDAVADVRRPNMPGAAGRPNWCLRLPLELEELVEHPLANRVAELLADTTRATESRQ